MTIQQQTLSLYAALTAFCPQWAGRLLLCIGMDRPLVLAALAAGAATLVLEADPGALREARQDVTFTVTTLDEALRALKNEVRQGRAITVALSGPTELWLKQMEERGVQPDVIAADAPNAAVTQFLTRGARLFQGTTDTEIAEDLASTPADRVKQDMQLLAAYPEQTQWLQAAPTLFPRELTRAYLLHQRLQPLP